MKHVRFLCLALFLVVAFMGCGQDTDKATTAGSDISGPALSPLWSWDTVKWYLEGDTVDDGTYGIDLNPVGIQSWDYVPPVGLFPKTYVMLNDSTPEVESFWAPDHDLLDLDGVNSMTHEFVFRKRTDHDGEIYRKGAHPLPGGEGDSNGFIIFYDEYTDRIGFIMRSTTSVEITRTAPIELNTWYVIDAVFDMENDSIITYVDGEYFSAHGLWFPDRSYANDYIAHVGFFNGDLDEYLIFDRKLQAPEIARRYWLRFGSVPGQ